MLGGVVVPELRRHRKSHDSVEVGLFHLVEEPRVTYTDGGLGGEGQYEVFEVFVEGTISPSSS